MLKSSGFFSLTIIFVLFALFTIFHGMFLTTSTLANNSDKSPLDGSPQWFQTKSKVIYLVMDGLRFDYLFKDTLIPEPELYKQERSHLFHEIFLNSPEKLIVCKAYADTPTLTVQRIPSVVTGGLPPKANIIMAFGALPIKEDSLIRQAHLAGRKPYFSGDSLWNDFFPDDLITTTETRSFDIKDDDVDVATVNFIDYITKNKDFNLVIGHMLALDHMGHYRGLGDPKLAEAIQHTDQLIKNIMDIMDENTTLMIVGDHGMDYSGEHGHGTPGETNTAIVAYHKKGFQKYNQDLSQVMRSINETTKLVKQEDIVPTISMLLGLPIPFSNMGQILTDAYPVGSFPLLEICPESSFEVQAVRDNYVNSLQIWNYFQENQEQSHLFKKPVYKYVQSLLKELESKYNEIQQMTKSPEKCSQIHEKAIDAILKSQFFATEVYRITRNTGSYDIPMVFLGIFALVLVTICYFLITQYIYMFGPQEQRLAFNLKNFCLSLKSLIPLAIILPIASTCAWYYGKKTGIYAFVGAYLSVIFWFIGSLSIFLLTKKDEQEKTSSPSTANRKLQSSDFQDSDNQVISIKAAKIESDDSANKKEDTSIDDPEDLPNTQNSKRASKHQDQTPLFGGENENTPFLPSSTLFIFQDVKYTLALVGIFLFSIYLIHIRNLLVLNLRYEKPASPYIALLLIGYRLGTIFRGKMIFTMLASVILCTYIHYQEIVLLQLHIMLPLGLLVGADYVYGEVYYIVKGLKTHRAWSLPYFISYAFVVIYRLNSTKETFLEEIVIPRAIWAILLGTLVLRKALKVEPEVWKRSAQLCLVIFLFLVRREREVLAFSLVLVLMKTTTRFFQKVEKRNFLFPLILAFEAYVGLFHLEFTDFNVPFNFKVAFIGLSRFSPIFSPIFFVMSYLSTIIIGLVHLSHYNQYLDSQTGRGTQVKLTDSEEVYDEKPEFLSVGHARIMKKRNIVLFLPYFNLVMISAAIRLFVLREEHFDLVLEKFMIDALFYIFSSGVAFFML